jgi:anti-sigma regulatory factor (Ser/Thr protein kinase)
MTACTKVFPGMPGSVREAREWVRQVLAAAECPAAADAEVCVSELVTNSVRHSRSAGPAGQVRVRLVVTTPDWVQIEVRDDGPASWPVSFGTWRDGALVPPGALAESGRGLYTVAMLAGHLGMDPKGGLVWCRLAWGQPGGTGDAGPASRSPGIQPLVQQTRSD